MLQRRKKPSTVDVLSTGIEAARTQLASGIQIKSFEEHLKETLEARKQNGREAVAPDLEKYQDATTWPQFNMSLPEPFVQAVKRRAFEVDDDEDEDDDRHGCCNCCGCGSCCSCGPRTLISAVACVAMLCCIQGMILRTAIKFLLQHKWRNKIADGIDLQTHVEALHFLYLCDNLDNAAGTSALAAVTGQLLQKKLLHSVKLGDKKFSIYNTGEFKEE
jgi:hypothetical protein